LQSSVDRNLRIDLRFTGVDTNQVNEAAAELVSLVPDAIVVTGTQSLGSANRQSQRIPIVAAAVGDPLALGMVGTLVRLDGNVGAGAGRFKDFWRDYIMARWYDTGR
jgi:putative ABC transport system substrate-binding protein